MSRAWIERDWINNIASSLDKFSWQGNTANFRCNICGDSDTNKSKRRAYFYSSKDGFSFKCHNCGESHRFPTYLKRCFPMEYQRYKVDLLKDKQEGRSLFDYQEKKKEPSVPPLKKELKRHTQTPLDKLSMDHPAVTYCVGRKIPTNKFERIFYTDNFSQWVAENAPSYNHKRLPKDSRILFVLKSEGKIIGVQARTLDPKSTMRFITLKFDANANKIYGLDYLDRSKPYFVVEGIIDSFFLPNSVALCGGDVTMSLSALDKDKAIIVLDNEPRSKDTVTRLKKAIDLGYSVCIWDNIDSKYKDINDMILKGGMTRKDVLKVISQGICSGVDATLRLHLWKRVKIYK